MLRAVSFGCAFMLPEPLQSSRPLQFRVVLQPLSHAAQLGTPDLARP